MSSPFSAPVPTVRLFGSAGLLSALPNLLGFHPSDALVIACLSARGTIAPVMRVDLSTFTPHVAAHLAAQAATFADRAAVVTYSQNPERDEVAQVMAVHLFGAGVDIVDTLRVSNDPATPDPQLQGWDALHGRRVLDSRAEVEASAQYDPTDQVTPEVAALIAQAETGAHPHEMVAAILADPAPTSRCVPEVLAAVRQLPDDSAATAVLCTVLSVLAYIAGDGALANVAIVRALAARPGYDPARTIDTLMSEGQPPAVIRAAYR
ncbi:hypothetical protein H4P1_00010 (plasmid) [Variovorax sp. PBS-H4]|uniref:DUF4192 family protein n=1 Tax=Variovorax sp. PBS-H4 TaxID=434008 RepID=UPI001319898F|nr:DUF4192 family protein [Variovorax sp. PBS-H4]VTU41378.1 hypothetical protein H4P1_00010 [Variovorax sp. PBS-H4]